MPDELNPDDYSVLWIAPLPIERKAALLMLDKRHDGRFIMRRGEDYKYEAGEICGHRVVIASFPNGREPGSGSAAALAAQAKSKFPNLVLGLLVGVAAGLPNLGQPIPRDIRLGDILVGHPNNDKPGIVAYDLGKETNNGLQLFRGGNILDSSGAPVMSAIGSVMDHAPREADHFMKHYEKMKHELHAGGTAFEYPGPDKDTLYRTNADGTDVAVERSSRPESERTRVWYGIIGSGEKVMKNAQKRDELRDKYNLIGLEMEAAGVINQIPVGVIRGVCDYGDNKKNKEWQPYAAAVAAAYAKEVLRHAGLYSKMISGKGSRKRAADQQCDETSGVSSDEEHTAQPAFQRHPDRAPLYGAMDKNNRLVLGGQGNMNVGPGSISIGGSQKFGTKKRRTR